MSTLTIYRGISGSGKSTDAVNRNAMRVSRDNIRVALFGDYEAHFLRPKAELKALEDMVTKHEHLAIEHHLKAGRDVISDNTNIEPKFAQAIADVGYRCGARVEVQAFDVPVRMAIYNNSLRANGGGHNVPEDVIRKQHDRFQNTKDWTPKPLWAPTPYTGTPGAKKACLVDIDGTLAHNNGKRGFFDWKSVGRDDPDNAVIEVVNRIALSDSCMLDDMYVILMSGRDEVCRKETEDWLREHEVYYDELFMRPEGDMRKDSLIKAELFDTHVRDNWDVQFVIDDRWQVIRDCWMPMGLKVFNVSGADRGEF
jgi:predicted kinase